VCSRPSVLKASQGRGGRPHGDCGISVSPSCFRNSVPIFRSPTTITMVLSSKRTVVSSASTSASATEALKILHDPKALIGLNPLVVSAVEGPQPVTDQHASSPPSQRYVITDKLPVVGSWCFHRSFSADFTRVKHGMDSRVDAGLGVRLYNQWRVREAEGGAVIEETIQLEVR
jgi:hypothetical protein